MRSPTQNRIANKPRVFRFHRQKKDREDIILHAHPAFPRNSGESRIGSRPKHGLLTITLSIWLLVPSLPAQAEAAFAFGRDTTGRMTYGSATNANTEKEATELAISRCSASGPNCQLIRQFHLGCFAFAPSINGAAGFGTGLNKAGAENRAITECAQHRGQQCVVQSSFCDTISEQLATGSQRIEFERSQLVQQHASAVSRGLSCDLSGKAITYTFQFCTTEKGCQLVKSYFEIVGDAVLYQLNKEQVAPSGIKFQLGRTVDVSPEASQLSTGNSNPQLFERVYATASFDGQDLTLRLDTETYLPDNILLTLGTVTERINIIGCSACVLKEYRINFQSDSGPPVSNAVFDHDQPCTLAPMK